MKHLDYDTATHLTKLLSERTNSTAELDRLVEERSFMNSDLLKRSNINERIDECRKDIHEINHEINEVYASQVHIHNEQELEQKRRGIRKSAERFAVLVLKDQLQDDTILYHEIESLYQLVVELQKG